MASFVQTNAHTPWRGVAMDATPRPVMACHVGDRRRTRAKRLEAKMPDASRQHAICYPDQYAVYARVILTAQTRQISTLARNTHHIERFNNTPCDSGDHAWYVRRCRVPRSSPILSGRSRCALVMIT
jgi:IS1 family transposase